MTDYFSVNWKDRDSVVRYLRTLKAMYPITWSDHVIVKYKNGDYKITPLNRATRLKAKGVRLEELITLT